MAKIINKLDLLRDYIEIISKELNDKNYPIEGFDDDRILIAYFNYVKRYIQQKPRHINVSSALVCPPELEEGYLSFMRKVISGDDINPHQSRNLGKLEYIGDRMLYEWDIFHFHLGTEIEVDGYVNRTGPLLYAYIFQDEFYFIGIFEHQNWSNSDLIKILHYEFPNTIERYLLKGVVGLSPQITDTERESLRRHQINTAVEIDGNVYIGPGQGFATSGHSNEAVMKLIDCRRDIKFWEKTIIEFVKSDNELFKIDQLIFSLEINEEGIFAYEKKNGLSIKIKSFL